MFPMVYLPFIICVVGLLIFILSVHEPIKETGRIMLFVGLLVTLMQIASIR